MFTKIKKLFILPFFLLFFTFTAESVDDFDYNFLNERLNRMELELSDIQKSLYSPENNQNNLKTKQYKKGFISSRHEIRINKLENDFRKITGQFEEIFFRIEQLQETIDKFTSDIDLRLSNTNNNFRNEKKDMRNDTYAYPQSNSKVDTSGGDTEILGTIKNKRIKKDEAFNIANNFETPESLYDYGKASLMNLEYQEAEIAFRGFVKKYPNNKLTPEAHYWIGESLFVREEYNQAILMYGEVIKKYKKNKKAPDSLLKVGIAFANLDKKKEACDALKQINKNYPKSDQAILKRAKYNIQQLKC